MGKKMFWSRDRLVQHEFDGAGGLFVGDLLVGLFSR